MAAPNAGKRVAVVVVHGIADQLPGQTVRELARLLCHGASGEPCFVQGELREVLVPVAKLEPGKASAQNARQTPSLPDLARSRQQPGSPSGFYQQHQRGDDKELPGAVPTDDGPDLGVELNDYLLGRLELSEQDALYEAARISLLRRCDQLPVDIYEMYWADLSRLGTGGLSALISLYRLFLNLGTLSADVVDQASLSTRGSQAWRLLQRLHAWMAWLMKAPAVLVQLSMLLLLLFGAIAVVPAEQQWQLLVALYGIGAIVFVGLSLLAWLHAESAAGRLKSLAWLLAALTGMSVAGFVVWDGRWHPYLYLATGLLVTGLCGAWLVNFYARIARGVLIPGMLLVVGTVLMLGLETRRVFPFITTIQEWLLTAALGTGELLFAVVLLVWTLFIALQMAALVLSLWLERHADARIRASLHTARVILIVSAGLFTLLSLVLASVFGYVAGNSVEDLRYGSIIFDTGFWTSAADFLDERIRTLGSFFTPLVVVSTLFGIVSLLVLSPVLLEELAPVANLDDKGVARGAENRSRRLGYWLEGGMRSLDNALHILVPIGAIAGGVLYLAFVARQVAFGLGLEGGVLLTLTGWLEYLQGEALVTAGKWLAGGALTIAALGARFTNTFGRLRVAIDAVLDVDNYFADPPDGQSPRARIFSRYASLLGYLRTAGYTRIVIVSHSQGTVISAELLRYLHVQGRMQEVVGDVPVALVTVGSPLRDLYAVRFPLLYNWMGQGTDSFVSARPAAADIGACEWVNACRSGDYVGRFIWTPATDQDRFRIAVPDADRRVSAQRAGDRSEFCLGAGGHTRYFSNDAVALGLEIERLIAAET